MSQRVWNWYNTGMCYSHNKDEIFIYRKINLATHERGYFQAGAELDVFPIKINNESINIGIQLCREIRFPEQWRTLALNNADVFVYLTNAVTGNNIEVWRSHLISRAAENQRFLISSNVAHPLQHCPTMVISPNGSVLDEIISEEEQYIRLKLDLSEVSNWYLDQCRTDIVEITRK
jgi:predicted amidohydrolase